MALRINPNIDDTLALVGAILTPIHKTPGIRVQFLVPAGCGPAYLQRVRVRISRERDKMRREGKKVARFTLHSCVYPHTENGKRYDSVIVWKNRSQRHELRDIVEEVLADER